jgi:hypothetical protein
VESKIIQVDGEWKLEVTSFGANVKTKSHQGEKTVWVTLTVPENEPIVVSMEDVVSLQNLENAMRKVVELAEKSLQPKGDF